MNLFRRLFDQSKSTVIEERYFIGYLSNLNNEQFASIANQREIKVWNTTASPYKVTLRGEHANVSCICSLDNKQLATGSYYGQIKIWDSFNFQMIKRLFAHKSCVLKIIVIGFNRFASCAQDQKIKVWDHSLQCISILDDSGDQRFGAMILFNNKFCAGSANGTIKLWNIKTFKLECSCIEAKKGNSVGSLAQVSYEVLAGCYHDFIIKLRNVALNKVIMTFTDHTSFVSSLVILKSGHLASGSNDKTIIIWNIKTFTKIATLTGHSEGIICLIQLPNGNLISGSYDKTLKEWELPDEAK